MRRVLAALLALALIGPPAAAGSPTNAPPGNSAIDEYLETVPGASGNGVPRTPAAGDRTLTAAQRKRLEQLGSDGKALADIVDSTAPAPVTRRPVPVVTTRSDEQGRSPAGAVLGVADGDGGMGLLLPAILLASLLTAIALVLLRRRSTA